MTELIAAIFSNWDTLDQSRFNGIMLVVMLAAIGIAYWSFKAFASRIYAEIRSDIQSASQIANEALKEIRELKLSERDHDGDIKRLKDDVDDLFGRQRKRK